MEEKPNNNSEEVFDASPYLKLVIDKDGRWFQNGAEIVHPEIYRLFNQMLEKTPEGEYLVRMGREICTVEVEDAPFVVKRIIENDHEQLLLELNDGWREPFAPKCFWIGEQNIPYCSVKNGTFHARFSRPAYYQLAQHIVTDETEKEFFLLLDGERIPIKR
jgi:uncharacterized protein